MLNPPVIYPQTKINTNQILNKQTNKKWKKTTTNQYLDIFQLSDVLQFM